MQAVATCLNAIILSAIFIRLGEIYRMESNQARSPLIRPVDSSGPEIGSINR